MFFSEINDLSAFFNSPLIKARTLSLLLTSLAIDREFILIFFIMSYFLSVCRAAFLTDNYLKNNWLNTGEIHGQKKKA